MVLCWPISSADGVGDGPCFYFSACFRVGSGKEREQLSSFFLLLDSNGTMRPPTLCLVAVLLGALTQASHILLRRAREREGRHGAGREEVASRASHAVSFGVADPRLTAAKVWPLHAGLTTPSTPVDRRYT